MSSVALAAATRRLLLCSYNSEGNPVKLSLNLVVKMFDFNNLEWLVVSSRQTLIG